MKIKKKYINQVILGSRSDMFICFQLLKVLRLKLSFKDRKRLKSKIWKTYDKLAAEPLDLHNELSKRIALVINHVAENPEVNFWKLLRQLLDQFDANVLRNETFSITYTEDELIKLEKWKEKRKNQLENKLKVPACLLAFSM